MRRPHVFQRSAPRVRRDPYHQPVDHAATGRLIAGQLGAMIDRAESDGLSELAALLDRARLAAEDIAASA